VRNLSAQLLLYQLLNGNCINNINGFAWASCVQGNYRATFIRNRRPLQMPPEIAETPAGNAPEAPKSGGKVRLLSLEDCDRRTNAYRKCADLIACVERDLGGHNRLSEAQRQLVRHAALTATMLEHLGSAWLAGEPIDPTTFSTLVNAARRGFEAVGLQRVPREVVPTVDRYLAGEGKAAP
jgi:hypothetical protein